MRAVVSRTTTRVHFMVRQAASTFPVSGVRMVSLVEVTTGNAAGHMPNAKVAVRRGLGASCQDPEQWIELPDAQIATESSRHDGVGADASDACGYSGLFRFHRLASRPAKLTVVVVNNITSR